MFSQIPSPSSTSAQIWVAAITAAGGAIAAVVAKKRFSRRKTTTAHPAPKGHDYITCSEFHAALDAIRDRMDANHRELLRTIGALAASVEKRLDALETAVARLDERIKNLAVAADVSRR
jgi:hypothetical protein